jgi:hypothetical protein
VNTQNRMNAGAEYVLYRIWGALQDHEGIHVESLLTCVGALAGYACQAYVRQIAALPGVDSRKYALTAVENRDGTTYLFGDAVNVPLAGSPLSVWALVGRAVQKLGKPLPDIEDIVRHVTQTVGTSAFGVPRAPGGRRPRHAAIVYLTQIWPQILPIAQRFCSKPAQLPVLFGIALQRAIEQTQDTLSPTLSASMAMECAVAMSKAALPEAQADITVTQLPTIPTEIQSALAPITAERGIRAGSTRTRTTPAAKRRGAGGADASARNVGTLIASLPPTTRIVTIVAVAIITVAGAMWKVDRRAAPEAARERPKLLVPQFQAGAGVQGSERAAPESQTSPDEQRAQEASALNPTPPSQETAANAVTADSPRQLDSSSDGSSEMVPSAELLPTAEIFQPSAEPPPGAPIEGPN